MEMSIINLCSYIHKECELLFFSDRFWPHLRVVGTCSMANRFEVQLVVF